MSKTVPYENATSGKKAREEILSTLRKFGCERVGQNNLWMHVCFTIPIRAGARPIPRKLSRVLIRDVGRLALLSASDRRTLLACAMRLGRLMLPTAKSDTGQPLSIVRITRLAPWAFKIRQIVPIHDRFRLVIVPKPGWHI